MLGAQYRKVDVYRPSLGVRDENDSMKYTKLLATQIKGCVLRTAHCLQEQLLAAPLGSESVWRANCPQALAGDILYDRWGGVRPSAAHRPGRPAEEPTFGSEQGSPQQLFPSLFFQIAKCG